MLSRLLYHSSGFALADQILHLIEMIYCIDPDVTISGNSLLTRYLKCQTHGRLDWI